MSHSGTWKTRESEKRKWQHFGALMVIAALAGNGFGDLDASVAMAAITNGIGLIGVLEANNTYQKRKHDESKQ